MKTKFCIVALPALALAGCVVQEPAPPVTTVTREVTTTTTGPAVRTVSAPAVTQEVVIPQAPPAVRVETQTVSPGPQYVWQRGYWRWNGVRYVWVPGRYVVGPRTGAVWVPGQYVQHPGGGYVYVEGHWQ